MIYFGILVLINSISMHSGPYCNELSLKSKIRIAVMDMWLTKVKGKYPGLPSVVIFPKLNISSKISTFGIFV